VQKLRSIQALRAVAVVAVVCSHAFASPYGSSGVDLFFVISGFIISRVSQDRSPVMFAKARFERIFPLYLLAASPYLLWNLVQPHVDWGRIAASLTLWPIWAGEYQVPFLHPAWSLYFEVLFYAGVTLWLVSPRLAGIAAAVIVLSALQRPSAATDFLLSPIILEFAAGYGLAKLRRFPFPLPALILGLALLLGLGQSFPAHAMLDASVAFTRVALCGVPAIMVVYAALGLEKFFAGRWSDVFVRVGDASYSIYLTHLIAVLGLPGMHPLGRVLAAILLGMVVHVFVERPLGTWFSKSSRRPAERATAQPVTV